MKKVRSSQQQLKNEIAELRNRLDEAQETLHAISNLEVDAIVVTKSNIVNTLILKDADYPYHFLVDSMGEGAVTINPEGIILFSNLRFAEMTQIPIEKLIGSSFKDLFLAEEKDNIAALLKSSESDIARGEFNLQINESKRFPIQLSAHALRIDNFIGITVVVTDISDRKLAEETANSHNLEMELLFNLSHALMVIDDINQIFEKVIRQMVETLQVTFARIAIVKGKNFVIRAAYSARNLDNDLYIGDQKPLTALSYCLPLLEGTEPIILDRSNPDIGAEERSALLLDHVQSLCLVPLRMGNFDKNEGNILGIIMLGEARNNIREPFTPQKLSFAKSIGEQIASRIRRMLLFEETERRNQFLMVLNEIDKTIISSSNLKSTIMTLLSFITNLQKIDAADVLLLDPGLQTLDFFCEQGFRTTANERTHLRLGESHAGRAALELKIVHVSNLQEPGKRFITPQLADENFVSYFGVPLVVKGQMKGVLEIFNRTPLEPNDEWLGMLNTLTEQVAIAIDNGLMFENLARTNNDLSQAYTETIEGWSHALDLRDKETENHSLRVTEYTIVLARQFGLNAYEMEQIRLGALLHDIGKMGVPDQILLKPDPLTDAEWVLMKKHPALAYELLSPIRHLQDALDIPYCHHEKWDGTGYPRGLKGEQIPIAARIFALVDVWDALRSDRSYRAAWPKEKVLAHIQDQAGSHFDPEVLKIFLACKDSFM